jgi:hypothetical protein
MLKVLLETLDVIEEPVPDFLDGLEAAALQDLGWLDESLGVTGYGWWPVDYVEVEHDNRVDHVVAHTYQADPDSKRIMATQVIAPLDHSVVSESILKRKAEMREGVKRIRNQLELAGFPYRGKMIDSDKDSLLRITISVHVAEYVGPSFEEVWTCADDSDLDLDQAGMLGMPIALATYASKLHTTSRLLKRAIQEAVTHTDLDAIDIKMGWPSNQPDS